MNMKGMDCSDYLSSSLTKEIRLNYNKMNITM
ncbi:hypothetical protein SAMN04515656_11041 [Eubacterium aggregans]|uniref:Uncharacterized protein n=1 Tax=Eubacterium aggregans TaxID=81409 RepID=A0A1H4B540_9FIRM|nr:hypothetical protein SAMN04515656_11041 [Eubacterium aggregans]